MRNTKTRESERDGHRHIVQSVTHRQQKREKCILKFTLQTYYWEKVEMISSVKISISSISTRGTIVQWLCELQRGRTSVSVTQPKYNDNFCFLSHADSVCTCLHVCVLSSLYSDMQYMYAWAWEGISVCKSVHVCLCVLTIYHRPPSGCV